MPLNCAHRFVQVAADATMRRLQQAFEVAKWLQELVGAATPPLNTPRHADPLGSDETTPLVTPPLTPAHTCSPKNVNKVQPAACLKCSTHTWCCDHLS